MKAPQVGAPYAVIPRRQDSRRQSCPTFQIGPRALLGQQGVLKKGAITLRAADHYQAGHGPSAAVCGRPLSGWLAIG
jgi:hypothetical protein